MLFDDYVMRQVRKIAELVAAIANRERAQSDEALDDEIADAYRGLLGVDESIADRMTSASLARLLGDRQAITALIELMIAHGDLLVERGNAVGAQRRWHKALELTTEGDPLHRALIERLTAQ